MENKQNLLFGVNYYPETWDIKEFDKDIDKIAEMGFNCVRLGEFAWSYIEPREGEYDFSLLRKTVDKCKEKGIAVVMCTPTAAPPRWLSIKYPEIMAVASNGQRMRAGARRNTCASSDIYIKYSKKIAEELAKEFQNDENIIGWQIDNEISANRFDTLNCCCDNCAVRFKNWMKEEFNGDVKALNDSLGLYVWSQDYSSFDEITPPQRDFWNHPGLELMWKRFQEQNEINYIAAQYEVLKEYVSVPIGHNGFMNIQFDFDKLAKGMDVAIFDEYAYDKDLGIAEAGFWMDYYRTMKDSAFWVAETSPSWNGDTKANYMRPYHFNKANVWLSYLSGAEMVNYWLWRAHYGGQELMHGSVLSSEGRETHIVGEIKELVSELASAREMLKSTTVQKAKIAIHISADACRMVSTQTVVPDFDYFQAVKDRIYYPIRQAQYAVDLISPRSAIDGYKVIVSPFLFHLNESEIVEKILKQVEKGSIWIVGPMSDIRTQYGTKFTDKGKGFLENIADMRNEFYLPKGEEFSIIFDDGEIGESVSLYYEALSVFNNTKPVAKYENGEYIKGYSAITETAYGKGKIVVLGCLPDEVALLKIVSRYASEMSVEPIVKADKTVLSYIRQGESDMYFTAVETGNRSAELCVPFDGVDVLSGRSYRKDEKVVIEPFGLLLMKQNK